jgi:hypothetical protein
MRKHIQIQKNTKKVNPLFAHNRFGQKEMQPSQIRKQKIKERNL